MIEGDFTCALAEPPRILPFSSLWISGLESGSSMRGSWGGIWTSHDPHQLSCWWSLLSYQWPLWLTLGRASLGWWRSTDEDPYPWSWNQPRSKNLGTQSTHPLLSHRAASQWSLPVTTDEGYGPMGPRPSSHRPSWARCSTSSSITGTMGSAGPLSLF
jgi:hypothetical protein